MGIVSDTIGERNPEQHAQMHAGGGLRPAFLIDLAKSIVWTWSFTVHRSLCGRSECL